MQGPLAEPEPHGGEVLRLTSEAHVPASLSGLAAVEGDEQTDYYALYLTPQLSNGSMVMVSNVWGHYHSRIVDNFELISAWADQFDEANA